MGFSDKYNKGSKFDVNTAEFEYKNLKELFEKNGADCKYRLLGFYINNKSKFGAAPVAICEGFFANLPSHELDTVKEMLADPETVQDIKAGTCGFVIEPYKSKNFGTDCLGVRWCDL